MSKILRVGDPHAMVTNLKDSVNLIDFIIKTANEEGISTVEFMGDLFHTHAVIRMEVLKFWEESFDKLTKSGLSIRTLVGNHDMCGSRDKEGLMSALDVFKEQVVVVDTPRVIDNIGYMPYTSNVERFIDSATNLYEQGATKTLIAHQTFIGAKYDNGFLIEDGVDLKLVKQENVISGHIHSMQQIDSCLFIGTPKWDNMSDANKRKGIWVFEHSSDGNILSKKFISTESVVTPINKYSVNEGEEVPELSPNAKNYIEFHGKTAWISKMKKKYKGLAGIKGRPTDTKRSTERKGSLILDDFLMKEFQPIEGVCKKEILDYISEKGVGSA